MKRMLLICLVLSGCIIASPDAYAGVTYVFGQDGSCLERNTTIPAPPLSAFQKNFGDSILLYAPKDDPAPGVPLDKIKGQVVDKSISGLVIDPDWTPPSTVDQLDEIKAGLAQVQAAVNGSLTVSEHDKRWLAQKEAAKAIAIPWIKAHPACTQAELQAAVFAALAAEYPGEPIVVNPDGIIGSYALVAQERGYIPTADFAALRDLVVVTSEKDLAKLLAGL